MVIILMGEASAGIARELAGELGWAMAEGPLHPTVARALDRREPTILACAPLTLKQREIVRGGRHGVRFVLLQSNGAGSIYQPGDDDTLVLDGSWPPPKIVSAAREEFGV